MRRHTLVLFPGNPTVEVSGSAVPKPGAFITPFLSIPSRNARRKPMAARINFPFGLVNTSRRSRIAAKLGLSRLFHKRAKHRLRGAIAHSELTDIARRGADRVQDKSSYETSFPGFARLPARRACQPAANQSSVSPAGGAPAACCPAWMLTAGFLTHIFIQQHLWCEVGPRVPNHLSTSSTAS